MRTFLFLSGLLVIPTAVFGLDVVHLKNGQILKCEIKATTDKVINFTLPGSVPGNREARLRSIPMDGVEYIDFGFSSGEESFFKNRSKSSAGPLKNAWDAQYGNLHRPRSRTAKYGIAYANALLKKGEEFSRKNALDIFDRIIRLAWAEEDKATARQGRLRALIALGRLDEAFRDATDYAKASEDPGILIEVKYLQAKVEFAQLKNLVEENPKWKEDDEIRPRRNQLYNSAVDQFLWPFLFYGTHEEAAVRGLRAAAGVYRSAGEKKLEKACLKDLKQLYPNYANKTQKEE